MRLPARNAQEAEKPKPPNNFYPSHIHAWGSPFATVVKRPILVLGYHGCTRATAEGVLCGKIKHLPLSTEKHEWLGDGVYFWEDSYDRALRWAEKKYGNDAAVVGAIILPGHCLDLTDSQCTTLLADYAVIFPADYLEKHKKQVPVNNVKNNFHPYDCALVNEYRASWDKLHKRKKIDSVRGAFTEGARIGDSSFSKLQHIQWAIVNPEKCILGYFRPTKLAE